MSQIEIQYVYQGALTNTTTTKLKDAGNAYGIKDAVSGAVVVAPTAALPSVSGNGAGHTGSAGDGVYDYDTTAIPAGQYLATWEMVTPQGTSYVNEPFTIDAAASVPAGTTLQAVERELAARVGPFSRETVGAGSTTTYAVVPALKSSLGFDLDEDMYLLRRGRYADGSVVIGFAADDRQRLVAEHDPDLGTLQPDRAWTNAPAQDEVIELHYLDPQRELRPAVLAGLRRCFFVDQVALTFSSAAAERDVTTLVPWLLSGRQVRALEWTYPNSPIVQPSSVGWYKLVRKGADTYLRAAADPFPNTLQLTALRPAWSYVNGATSLAGPDDDDDLLAVDADYAAASAHAEAWRRYPTRLFAPAEAGRGLSRADAAAEFTVISRVRCPLPAAEFQIGDPGGRASYGPQF